MTAHYSRAAMAAFETFFLPWRRRRLFTAPIVGMPRDLPAGRPLVLVANHTSWWDGFLLRDVHRALRPRAPLFTVMTARELQRHPFFRLIGALPLDARGAGGVRTMLRDVGAACRAHPDAAVAFFPQGAIRPAWHRPLGFRRGIELLLDAIGPCVVLPVALHIEPLARSSPTAFTFAAPPLHWPDEAITAAALERFVAQRLDDIARILAGPGVDAFPHPELAP